MFLFTNRGEKLGKTRPRSFSQFPWDFVVLDFERLETPKLQGRWCQPMVGLLSVSCSVNWIFSD